jgi:hypothetical protein
MGRSVSHTDLLSEYNTSHILGNSFRRKVVSYIERCHLEDGGYFFARVLPSNGLDTYFAVKSLSILGVEPDRPEAIASFFLKATWEGYVKRLLMTVILWKGVMCSELRGEEVSLLQDGQARAKCRGGSRRR